MSFLTSRLASSARSSVTRSAVSRPMIATPSFHTSTIRRTLSESDHSHNHEDRSSKIEAHKQDQLKKQKEGKGHWVKELASNSEAAIKADRDEIDATQDSIDKLQKETEDLLESKTKGSK